MVNSVDDLLADSDRLPTIVATILGVPRVQDVTDVAVTPVSYDFGSPATAALLRVGGSARRPDDETPVRWRAFVKVIQHVRYWDRLHLVPAEFREDFASTFPWRHEIDVNDEIAAACPAGLRTPDYYALERLGEDRVAVWMEDVDVREWQDADVAVVAGLLGRLAARRAQGREAAPSPYPVGMALRMFVVGRVLSLDAPQMTTPQWWQQPEVSAAVAAAGVDGERLRRDLGVVAASADDWLAELDACPQTLAHGDASPQNLLATTASDGCAEYVVIDAGFGGPLAVGHDLGQLVVGRVHAGLDDPDTVARRWPEVVAAYTEGLWAEEYLGAGGPQGPAREELLALVGRAATLTVVLRSAFPGLTVDPPKPGLLADRIRLTRALLDLLRGAPVTAGV